MRSKPAPNLNSDLRTNFNASEVVFSQGDPGHIFYVVDSGEFNVCVKAVGDEEAGHGQVVHTYKGGGQRYESFGEQALMFGQPRGATIVAKTRGSLWALHRQTFQLAVKAGKKT